MHIKQTQTLNTLHECMHLLDFETNIHTLICYRSPKPITRHREKHFKRKRAFMSIKPFNMVIKMKNTLVRI